MSYQAENRTAGQQVHIEDGIFIAREKKKKLNSLWDSNPRPPPNSRQSL